MEVLMKCKKCNSSNIKKEYKDLNSDNIVHIYICQDCGHKENKIVNVRDNHNGEERRNRREDRLL